MKFLTIRQPWASLIAVGAKTVETRPFSTTYRGPLAIHAGISLAHVWPDEDDDGDWHVAGDGPCDGITVWRGPKSKPAEARFSHPATSDIDLPLGAVVAVCDLVDVVPIVPMPDYVMWRDECKPEADRPYWDLPRTYVAGHDGSEGDPSLWLIENGGRYISQRPYPITDQLPFGDFTPGRYAWLIDNVRPIDPVPMKGAQGLRDVPADVIDRLSAPLPESGER